MNRLRGGPTVIEPPCEERSHEGDYSLERGGGLQQKVVAVAADKGPKVMREGAIEEEAI